MGFGLSSHVQVQFRPTVANGAEDHTCYYLIMELHARPGVLRAATGRMQYSVRPAHTG